MSIFLLLLNLKKVRCIQVLYPEEESWKTIKTDYLNLKGYYKQKYSIGDDFDFFDYPYEEGDGYEMIAVENGKCHYTSFFDTLSGCIMISISEYKKIHIVYEDATNTSLNDNEKDSLILNDI